MAGVSVRVPALEGSETTTDKEGRFRLENLVANRMVPLYAVLDKRQANIMAKASTTDVEIVIKERQYRVLERIGNVEKRIDIPNLATGNATRVESKP